MSGNRVPKVLFFSIITAAFMTVSCQFQGVVPTFNKVRDSVVGFLPAGKLDIETLDKLTILWPGDIQMKPGSEKQFEVGIIECCYVFTPVKARVSWSIEPAHGAAIDAESGLLTIDNTVVHGSQYKVTANIENGRKLLEKTIFIFTEEANPFAAGAWREIAQISCQDGSEFEPVERIGEVTFNAAGKIYVTWHPFEVYHDYWGTYSYDLALETFDFSVEDGNYIPADMDTSGYFEIDSNGDLIMRDIWLGSPRDNPAERACGHRLSR